jgi:hypothetical protein
MNVLQDKHGTDAACGYGGGRQPPHLFNQGYPQFAPELSPAARAELRWQGPIPLTKNHRARLAWHRERGVIAAT